MSDLPTNPVLPLHHVRFGDLHRLVPISAQFGFDRGKPIDRYYIESFLDRNATDVCGRVLEVGDDSYARQFGGNRLRRQDILDISQTNDKATIIGDLGNPGALPAEAFDCIIVTQTLQFIYNLSNAVECLYRSLDRKGVLLVTLPGISQLEFEWDWYWSFTPLSASRLFSEVFGDSNVEVQQFGNVFAATVFLYGLAVEEVSTSDLDACDPKYPVIITVRAQKP